jgi:hypothetical protein
MLRIVIVLAAFLAFGAALAASGNPLPLQKGWIGGAALVLCALWARRRWRQEALTGQDPSAAERRAWLYMAGHALICGFVLMVLLTPGSEVHRNSGDTGGYDSWIMLACGAIAWTLLHEPRAPLDERDRAIDALAQRVGYGTLVGLLLVLLLALGFAPKPMMARFTHWLIANTLLNLIMFASLAQYVAQLVAYRRDAAALAAAEASGLDGGV